MAAPFKLTQPKIPESVIQRQIKDYLTYKGWFCFKIHQSLGSMKGISDLIAIKNGFTFYIEVKAAKGKLSPDQEKFRDEIVAHGGKYIVARDIKDVEGLG